MIGGYEVRGWLGFSPDARLGNGFPSDVAEGLCELEAVPTARTHISSSRKPWCKHLRSNLRSYNNFSSISIPSSTQIFLTPERRINRPSVIYVSLGELE